MIGRFLFLPENKLKFVSSAPFRQALESGDPSAADFKTKPCDRPFLDVSFPISVENGQTMVIVESSIHCCRSGEQRFRFFQTA